jgi:hypothetical protein
MTTVMEDTSNDKTNKTNKSISSYIMWIFDQRSRADSIGDLARDAFADDQWDGTMKGLKAQLNDKEEAIDAFCESVQLFRDQKPCYYKEPLIKKPKAK